MAWNIGPEAKRKCWERLQAAQADRIKDLYRRMKADIADPKHGEPYRECLKEALAEFLARHPELATEA